MTGREFYALAGKQIYSLVKPYGFRRRGRFFYRITEEGVTQQFCLLWLHRSFTIRFYVSSIYGYNGHDIEGDEIYELINGSINQWLSDGCSDRGAPDYMDSAAEICLQTVHQILLPFFENRKDPVSAREAVVAYNPRIQRGLDKYDLRELGFYLGVGDLDAARNILLHYIENSDRYNKVWWHETEAEYHSLLDAICTNDSAYIATYMENKKQSTFDDYRWKP